MSEDVPTLGTPTSPRHIPHYHGDTVRILFVIAAGLMFLAELLNARLPLSPGGVVLAVILLVVAAGVTNPVQRWIHWTNLVFSLIGLMLFGGAALAHFRSGAPFRESFILTCLAVVFLLTLYLATRTVRGLSMHRVQLNEQAS